VNAIICAADVNIFNYIAADSRKGQAFCKDKFAPSRLLDDQRHTSPSLEVSLWKRVGVLETIPELSM
jgi:hypothetical protein